MGVVRAIAIVIALYFDLQSKVVAPGELHERRVVDRCSGVGTIPMLVVRQQHDEVAAFAYELGEPVAHSMATSN